MSNRKQKVQPSSVSKGIAKPIVGSSALSFVYKICNECYGQIDGFSKCCDAEVENNKCSECGRFCKSYPCSECGGHSVIEIRIEDEVEIFMYRNSPQYLKEQFGKRFNISHTYKGIVTDLIDKNTVKVKLSNRVINVNVSDIEVC